MSKHDHGRPADGRSGGSSGTSERPYPCLEDCDLSFKLSKEEEAKRLGQAQRRLLHLRLINGGQLNEGKLGPPVCVVFEGWDAAGEGGRHQAPGRARSTPATSTSPPSPPPRPTSCATTSCGGSGHPSPAGAA